MSKFGLAFGGLSKYLYFTVTVSESQFEPVPNRLESVHNSMEHMTLSCSSWVYRLKLDKPANTYI